MNDIAANVCPACGAERSSAKEKCWLCMAPSTNPYATPPIDNLPAAIIREVIESPPALAGGAELLDKIVAYVLIALVVLVGVGVAMDQPSALIGYGLLLLPGVLGATRTRSRQSREGQVGFFGSRTAALLRGGITIVVVYFLIILALIILLFAFCAVSVVRP